MTHQQTQWLHQQINELAVYLLKEKKANGKLNYAIGRNLKKLREEDIAVREAANSELKDLEDKAYQAGAPLIENPQSDLEIFEKGFSTLSEEEKTKHDELLKEHHKFLSTGESGFEPFRISRETIEQSDLSLEWTLFLQEHLEL